VDNIEEIKENNREEKDINPDERAASNIKIETNSGTEPWMKVYNEWDEKKLGEFDIQISEMKKICDSTYWNTLETTVILLQDNKTFIITGDIHDMWLRDSTEQVQQYIPLIKQYPYFKLMLKGLVLKQAELILYDSYGNSYKLNQYCYDTNKQMLKMRQNGYIATRDHEIDSGCFFIKLLYQIYSNGCNEIINEELIKNAIKRLMKMWLTEQYHNEKSNFKRKNANKISDYTGMVYTSNRPSDDPVTYGYHIPDNIFLHFILNYVIIFGSKWNDIELINNAKKLKNEIYDGIMKYGIYKHNKYGKIYCYEVDGLGNCKSDLDDANVPSLLSIPYYSNEYDKQIYYNTRKYILSDENNHYFKNEYISGIGSPHTPNNNIWPIGLVSEGLTSNNINDKYRILNYLIKNTGETNMMHESFNIYNSKSFTRPWFAWANSYFSLYANCLNQFINKNDIKSEIEGYLDRNKMQDRQGSIDASKTILNDKIPTKRIPWIEQCPRNHNIPIKYRNIQWQQKDDPNAEFGRRIRR